MAVDCLKLNQVVAQQQLHTLHGIIYKVSQTWYAVNDLGNVFFSILIRTEDQNSLHSWEMNNDTHFQFFLQVMLTLLPPQYNLQVCSPLRYLASYPLHLVDTKYNVYYTDKVILIEQVTQAVAGTLDSLVKHLFSREWETQHKHTNTYQDSETQNTGWVFTAPAVWGMLQNPIQSKKSWRENQRVLVGLSGFWRPHIPHLGMVLQPRDHMAQKATGIRWDAEQESLSSKSRYSTGSPATCATWYSRICKESCGRGRKATWSVLPASVGR